MKQKLLLTLAALLPTVANAYDAYIGGIYYNFSGDEATVTRNGNNSYSGSVIIPASVTYGGMSYSVTSIGSSAFYGSRSLISITIPSSVTNIGDYAFYNCSSLTSVTIPNSVTSIGQSAFYNCTGLTSITIGNGVTNIGSSAFSYCSGLTSIIIDSNAIASITRTAGTSMKSIFGEQVESYVLGNSVTCIGDYAFFNCTSLKSVTVGSGVMSIGSNAFRNTSPQKVIWLTNTPPNGYTNLKGSVNYVANDKYNGLTNVTIYPFLSSLFEVGGVKYVPVSPSERTCDAIDCVYDKTTEHIGETVTNRGITLTVRKINPYLCYKNKYIKRVNLSSKSDIANNTFENCSGIVGATIDNRGKIGTQVFYNCEALQTVKLGQYITSIGEKAFYGCLKLKSIVIPDAVNILGNNCFENCSSMTSVKIGSGVKAIPTYAFNGCFALPTIQIPQNVATIGDYGFNGCTSLKTVLMDDGEAELTLGSNGSNPLFANCPLDSVYIGRNINYPTASDKGYSPFYRNTKLCSVTITDKETEISPNEFYGCTSLKNVRIGDGVTSFGDWAFSGCSSLDYFAFGSSVETIGKEAFSDCSAMTKLISRAATPPVCGTQALDDINKWECTLLVPDGSLALYQAANQWKEFFFMDIDPDGIKEIENKKLKVESSVEEWYDLSGRKLDKPQRGINIIRYADGTNKKVLVK